MTSQHTNVVIIGGGISGLAAAYELEQHGVRYTLIEVKPRLGGSIISYERDGFVFDGGVFAFPVPTERWQTLDDLQLSDALFSLPAHPRHPPRMAFTHGTQMLVDALAAKLNGTIINRMAAIGIGNSEAGTGYRICMENGIALEADAVIVAISARYAERLFRSAFPAVSAALTPYYYDQVVRVALGYLAETRPPEPPTLSPDMFFAAMSGTTHPARAPEGGMFVQAALRMPYGKLNDAQIIRLLTTHMRWKMPSTYAVHYWAESDPLSVALPNTTLTQVRALLSPRVRLIGSCYSARTLPLRTYEARTAAREVVAAL